MKCKLIMFSPAGGTKKAAEILCQAISSDIEIFDLTDQNFAPVHFAAGRDELAVIAMPSYGGRVPGLAAERLKKIHADGMPCVLLCVYGNRAYEDTLVEMEDLAGQCGFVTAAAAAAIAEHSIMHQYASGRPDASDEQKLREFGERIAGKLAKGQLDGKLVIPGNRPYKKPGGAGLVPKASSDCVGCGLCAKQCPAGAIEQGSLKSADAKKCISCMRCVVMCPHSARKVNSAMVSVVSLALKKECSIRKECEIYL